MSKLEIVKNALESNPDIVIVDVAEKVNLGEQVENVFDVTGRKGLQKGECVAHSIDYRVAPKNGLYTTGELDDFKSGLVPGHLELGGPHFHQYKAGRTIYLEFGYLLFCEKIGEERRITRRDITLTHDIRPDVSGLVAGRQINETELRISYQRKIYVYLYPNEAIAMDILEGKLHHIGRLRLKDLRKYQPDLRTHKPGYGFVAWLRRRRML